MKGIVALSEGLSNIREMLEQEGYEVVRIPSDMRGADVVVVTGMDSNMSGVQSISSNIPVIDATGREPWEILDEVQRYVELRGK